MRKAERRLYTFLREEVSWFMMLVAKLWESTGGCWWETSVCGVVGRGDPLSRASSLANSLGITWFVSSVNDKNNFFLCCWEASGGYRAKPWPNLLTRLQHLFLTQASRDSWKSYTREGNSPTLARLILCSGKNPSLWFWSGMTSLILFFFQKVIKILLPLGHLQKAETRNLG